MSVRSVFRTRIGSRSVVGASLPLGAFTLHSCLFVRWDRRLIRVCFRYRPRLLPSFVVAS